MAENAINQVIDSYDALDKKIIKTKKDQELKSRQIAKQGKGGKK